MRSKAGVFQFSSVGKNRTPVRVENKDLLRDHIDELSKLPFALPELFFGPLSVRDVPVDFENALNAIGTDYELELGGNG